MFSKIGTGELLLILVIAILVIGPTKLPKLAKSFGKAISTAKGYMKDVTDEIKGMEGELKEIEQDIADVGKDIKSSMSITSPTPSRKVTTPQAAAAVITETVEEAAEQAAETAEVIEAAAEAAETTEVTEAAAAESAPAPAAE